MGAPDLHKTSQEKLRFKWGTDVYQFLCLCFGLGPAPRMFTKLLKVPIALMRRLNVRLIIYLDDILILACSPTELYLARDTMIYLLQNLGFLINIKKSQFQATQKIQFLGVEINSLNMSLSLPQEKVSKIIKQCQEILKKEFVSLRELTSLIGRLTSSAIAVLPSPLQYCTLQRQQIWELNSGKEIESLILLNENVKQELHWWIQNLNLSNGRALIPNSQQIVISSDASMKGWGAYCQGQRTGGPWNALERTNHINYLELKAAKFWEILIGKGITITVEHLAGRLNVEADFQSRSVKDSSEWKLCPKHSN